MAQPLREQEWDTLLPSQTPRQRILRPERALLVALFWHALEDLQGRPILDGSHTHDPHAREKLCAEAAAWIASDDESWPFSFVSVCWHLSLDPHVTRRALGVRVSMAA